MYVTNGMESLGRAFKKGNRTLADYFKVRLFLMYTVRYQFFGEIKGDERWHCRSKENV